MFSFDFFLRLWFDGVCANIRMSLTLMRRFCAKSSANNKSHGLINIHWGGKEFTLTRRSIDFRQFKTFVPPSIERWSILAMRLLTNWFSNLNNFKVAQHIRNGFFFWYVMCVHSARNFTMFNEFLITHFFVNFASSIGNAQKENFNQILEPKCTVSSTQQ